MYNAVSKLHPLLIATALLLASCGSKNDESAQAGKLENCPSGDTRDSTPVRLNSVDLAYSFIT